MSVACRGLVEQFAELARTRFAPRAARFDSEAAFPVENYRDLHAAGLLRLTVPQAFGGVGADPLTYALCMVELAKGCSATALTFNMHATVMTIVDTIASEEQKRRVFAEVVEGGKLVASLGSEPGSSFRERYVVQTRFEPVEGGYRVKGVKHFASIGDNADLYAVIGLIEGTTSARNGLLCALIHRDNGGITVERTWDTVGMRGTRSDTIHFDTDRRAGRCAWRCRRVPEGGSQRFCSRLRGRLPRHRRGSFRLHPRVRPDEGSSTQYQHHRPPPARAAHGCRDGDARAGRSTALERRRPGKDVWRFRVRHGCHKPGEILLC